MVCSSLERARALEVAKELRRPYTFQALDIDDGSIILHLKSPISSPDIPYRFSFGVPLSLSTHYITTRLVKRARPYRTRSPRKARRGSTLRSIAKGSKNSRKDAFERARPTQVLENSLRYTVEKPRSTRRKLSTPKWL